VGVACVLAVACGDDDDTDVAVDAGPDATLDAGPGQDAGWEEPPPFPDGFLWGAATAPVQIEGGLHESDWWRWERTGHVDRCESADDGPDSWDRWTEDLDAAEAMDLTAYRFGIDWSRLYPTRDAWEADTPDPDAVARYHEMLQDMGGRGIEPMVTLQHFALPIWLSDPCDLEGRPGWLNPGIVGLFAEWSRRVAAEFGDEVDLWITINEPVVYAVAAHFMSLQAPGARHDGFTEPDLAFEDVITNVEHMIWAHAAAYDAIHAVDGAALVSIAKNNRAFEARHPDNPAEVEAAEALQYGMNRLFLNAVTAGDLDLNLDKDTTDEGEGQGIPELQDRLDFIGLNYYSRTLVTVIEGFPLPGFPVFEPYDTPDPKSDMSWDIYPSGFARVLEELRGYDLPVYITENGTADSGDVLRSTFLVDHLDVLARAIAGGLDVRGYFHWSLIDNFEWNSGFCPKFGLYRIDPATGERVETEGARTYRDIIEAGAVTRAIREAHRTYGEPTACQATACATPAEECP
jgi:beta-glucosidase